MIQKRPLLHQLKKLDKLYNDALLGNDNELPKYYSRLAVLELGSWVEECMDDIVKCYPKRKKIQEVSSRQYIDDIVIKNHGFNYNDNFRKMLKRISGIVLLERVERKMNSTSKQGLESALTKIYPERNDHAHKPIHLAPNFTSPSVCISLFDDIYKGLKEYEKQFKNI
jgi:hypothetical protein